MKHTDVIRQIPEDFRKDLILYAHEMEKENEGYADRLKKAALRPRR